MIDTNIQGALVHSFRYFNVKVLDKPEGPTGLPVFDGIELEGFRWNSSTSATKIGTKNLKVPFAIIEVSEPKNIVTTVMAGEDEQGKEVIEHMSKGAPRVTIKLMLAGENGKYPDADIKELKQFIAAPVVVNVISGYLNNMHAINQLVITDATWPHSEYVNLQPVELSCIASLPVVLEFKNETELRRLQ